MATLVGAVFLLEGIVSVLYSFLQVKTLLRFSDGRCLRFDAIFLIGGFILKTLPYACLWSVHKKSELLLGAWRR
uniref:Uncharacterized protein n=1 Tax=Oryza glumipatula TaxID=40148 RepID=A0A0E0B164_9ORYZ